MYNVTVRNFYVVTNGKKYSQKLYDACYRLYNLCDENEISGFCISDDEFHRECIPDRIKWEYNKIRYAAYPYYLTDYRYDENMTEDTIIYIVHLHALFLKTMKEEKQFLNI